MGSLGYLTHFKQSEAERVVEEVATKEFVVTLRCRLSKGQNGRWPLRCLFYNGNGLSESPYL